MKDDKAERGTLSMHVSHLGALSIEGLGRFPVTLYKEEWLKLLDIADDIRQFIKANDSRALSAAGIRSSRIRIGVASVQQSFGPLRLPPWSCRFGF